jgi:RHS repeat-associated protein
VAASAGGSTKAPAFGFTGQRFDAASNVYDYGARFYDPTPGRFLQPDSIVPGAYDSQALNRYAYVRNNPLGRIDPSGNWDLDFGGMIGEWVGGFFGTIGEGLGRIGGGLVSGLIPGPGEVADAGILLDPRESSFDRWLAAGSLGLSVLTLGLSPNFGSWGRSVLSQWDTLTGFRPEALSSLTPDVLYPTHGTWGADLSSLFDDAASGTMERSAARGTTRAVQPFFPANNGFLGESSRRFLMAGERIDRFGGSASSRFFSPAGTPTAARALPPGTAAQKLRTFDVIKPFEVEAGTVAPAFGELGFGTQFRTPVPLETLLKRGIIEEVF